MENDVQEKMPRVAAYSLRWDGSFAVDLFHLWSIPSGAAVHGQ
jgi:hypothetical protein